MQRFYLIPFFLHQYVDCNYRWTSQPLLPNTRGCGNILIPAAVEFARIGKPRKFAEILKLRFIDKRNYYEHGGDFIFPKVHSAWEKNGHEQINEIRESGRSLYLAVDGQCDSPGHNATYNTVTMLDTETNKILDFSIVHVKVSPIYR